MKHIFVVNPASGHVNATELIDHKIESLKDSLNYAMYVTKKPGDAIEYIRNYCREHQEPVRFYACGGDGTLNEVVNGAAEFEHAAVGCVPCGSGNDFVKYYGDKEAFLDIDRQIAGREVPIDLIRVGSWFAINAVHFGFDSCVADLIPKLRRHKFIGGRLAYPVAVAKSLFTGMHHTCVIEVDGERLNESDDILLCTIANGRYVGGSYRCAPFSKNDDGLLEVCAMLPVSIPKFIRIAPVYQRGEHFDDPRFESIRRYKRGKLVHISAPEGFIYAMDGEIVHGNDFTVEIVPNAIRFVVPDGIQV